MCEWSGHNVRVNMECASASTVMCEWSGHNMRVLDYVRVVRSYCASRNVRVVQLAIMCEYGDVRVISYVRVVRS